MMNKSILIPGALVYFSNEVRPYKVRAADHRFAICTKPFNLRKTYFYTIIDLQEQWRAPEDRIFHCYDLKQDRHCMLMLRYLQRGSMGLSRRRGTDLNIVRIIEGKKKRAKETVKHG